MPETTYKPEDAISFLLEAFIKREGDPELHAKALAIHEGLFPDSQFRNSMKLSNLHSEPAYAETDKYLPTGPEEITASTVPVITEPDPAPSEPPTA